MASTDRLTSYVPARTAEASPLRPGPHDCWALCGCLETWKGVTPFSKERWDPMGATLLKEPALLGTVKPSSCLSVYPCDVLPLGVCPALSQFFFFFFFGNRLEQSHECFKSKIDTQPLTYIESHYLRSSLIEFWAQQDIYFLKGQPCFVYWLVYLKMFTFLSHWHTQMNKNVFPGCF